MSYTEYDDEAVSRSDSSEPSEDDFFTSECIPEEDGGTNAEAGNNAGQS